MPTSNHSKTSAILLYISLVLIAIICTWFSQNSINAYWQQRYHQPSLLTKLENIYWWRIGGQFQLQANEFYQNQLSKWENYAKENEVAEDSSEANHDQLTSMSEPIITDYAQDMSFTEDQPQAFSENPVLSSLREQSRRLLEPHSSTYPIRKINPPLANNSADILENYMLEPILSSTNTLATENTIPALEQALTSVESVSINEGVKVPTEQWQVVLNNKDKVLFAGDSLMQGVAPHVQKWLKTEYHIQSLNLSKQSTGLSYPSFFDWPQTIDNTIKNNPNIKLLVMFLGPNDPWDFPDPTKKNSKYLKFQSPEWEAVYKQRIQHILDSANKANIQVIWLGIPYMKKQKLNSQTSYLNQVFQSQVHAPALFLPTDMLLSNQQNHYVDSIEYHNKKVRVRSKDGIHFSLDGQRILAEYIQQHIIIK